MRKISKRRYDFYTIFILVIIAQSSFNSEFSFIVISTTILLVTLIIFVGNDVLKNVTIWQKLGVVMSHGMIIFLASAFLYVLLAFILEYITIAWVGLMVKFLLLILTLLLVFNVLGRISLKLTDGKFKMYEDSE